MDCRVLRFAEERAGQLVVRAVEFQRLWGGYGRLWRLELESGQTVIVKWVEPPLHAARNAWAHARKLRSYEIEVHFYAELGPSAPVRVPSLLGFDRAEGRFCLLLEDLDAAGYPERLHRLSDVELAAVLHSLARFHAFWVGRCPSGVWPEGGYWHLGTRLEEFERMASGPFRRSAHELDRRLTTARFRTLLHGDAKLENFCFPSRMRGPSPEQPVALLDFQYVGGGVGTKDVAYFLSSCLSELDCARRFESLLDVYFGALEEALRARGEEPEIIRAIEMEWRQLFPVAWADFYRFLGGWAPGVSPPGAFSHDMLKRALRE